MGTRLLLALTLAACGRTVQAPAAPQAPAPEVRTAKARAPEVRAPEARVLARHAVLREEARALLERHCGECHVGTRPTARPGALAVFDLVQQDWSARMSVQQLSALERRIAGKDLAQRQRAQLHEYVAAEQALRSAAPASIP
jgi:hypothetical protein